MKAKITSRLVKSLRAFQKSCEVADTEVAGFILRVQPSGTMIYYASYRLEDRRRNRVRLGSARVLSPLQARGKAKEVLAEKLQGARSRRVRSSTLRAYAGKSPRKRVWSAGGCRKEERCPHTERASVVLLGSSRENRREVCSSLQAGLLPFTLCSTVTIHPAPF